MDHGDTAPPIAALCELVAQARIRAAEDPFGNPTLSVALVISRWMDRGELDLDGVAALVMVLRDRAFDRRARRLAEYAGAGDPAANTAALARLAAHLAQPDAGDSPVPFATFRGSCERPRFAAVFTAHPTFAHPAPVFHALAEAASGRDAPRFPSHRPQRPTLEEEFTQAVAAIGRGRDALDQLNQALLASARATWPNRWTTLVPRPVILASWVGYDTDGRTDIGWWDTMRLRLRMKRLQLERVQRQVAPWHAPLEERLAAALDVVDRQIALAPTGPDPDAAEAFAAVVVGEREAALPAPDALLPLFDQAIADAGDEAKLALCVARAGLVGHGMGLAHTHVRLNATQLHNVVRQRLGLADLPGDLARRRALLAAIGAALDTVQAAPVDFGALLAEQASAAKLMMTVAQIAKHIDAASPIRFLIAETESGYTLLAALWLARLLGCADRIEISPLFETAEALERGGRVLEEALRSPHWRDYLRRTGRLALQFGYSDSGRYVGQLDASYLIERLRLKVADALARHGMSGIEVVLFDTHGESIGRGAHPGSMTDRLKYLSPTASRQALAAAGVAVREESAFQGGDGYLHFGSPELALATVTRIAEHAFAEVPAFIDPIYADADFAVDFFATCGMAMRELVEDPGYAALLGAFGPALLDATGSRPTARQTELGEPKAIRHPRELRAIPNNAILQQLGWCANTLQGLGAAALRYPEPFAELRRTSTRFRRATGLAAHALLHSDLDVLRGTVAVLDPGTWLDRAAHATVPGRREALVTVARALERLGLWAPVQGMFRRVQADHLALRAAWPDAPAMADEEALLHALRLTLVQRIWLLATEVPDFSPRHGVTPQALLDRIIQLDVPAALALLTEVFPAAGDPAAERDYHEPQGPRGQGSYAREHAVIFEPMRQMFHLVREIGTAVSHGVGAFG